MYWFILPLVVIIGFLLYVRLAPSDVARWHRALTATEDSKTEGSTTRVIAAREGLMGDLDKAMMGLERTTRLAGSVDEGFVTYVTRTKMIGFPDYTTIQEKDGQIALFARLRFGRSDFGVNGKRLAEILAQVQH